MNSLQKNIKLIECPRDAMQGLHDFIPTQLKAEYINMLLRVGFDTLDFGSFVSPKAIPQMKDTAEVLSMLDLSSSQTKLLAIIANQRGAEDAVQHAAISYLGFPFSVSETFQLRNTNSTIAQSFDTVKRIQELCSKNGKTLVIYISMGFGNPYGDPWNTEIVGQWTEKMIQEGIHIISLADTVGMAKKEDISYLFSELIPAYPGIEFGAHLHVTPQAWEEKLNAAAEHGCSRFDMAIRGFGGCPMAEDRLTGNLATENAVKYFLKNNYHLTIDREKLNECILFSNRIFYVAD